MKLELGLSVGLRSAFRSLFFRHCVWHILKILFYFAAGFQIKWSICSEIGPNLYVFFPSSYHICQSTRGSDNKFSLSFLGSETGSAFNKITNSNDFSMKKLQNEALLKL